MIEKQLKITMISVHSCPLGRLGEKDTGGMSIYVRELARQLGEQGHLIDVYTRVHDTRGVEVTELGENSRLIHIRAGESKEMHKLRLYPHLNEFAHNMEEFRKLNAAEYDLIHSHYWLSGWIGALGQRWWGAPHCVMFHTIGAVKNDMKVGQSEPKLRLQTERYLANNCRRIIAATTHERDQLVQYYAAAPENIGVVPCGVNLELFKPMDKSAARLHFNLNGEKVLLYVGRMDPLKGVENLLHATRALKEYFPIKLVAVGGGDQSQPELKRLRKLSAELQIEDSVSFMGSMRQEELPPLYNAADVCVVPSYYESFGLVALESLACGTPVVASRVGGISNVVRDGETGYILEENRPQFLTETIAKLFSNQSPCMNSAELIRETVEGFSWSRIAENMLPEYEEMLC